jgi:hypothetical protein
MTVAAGMFLTGVLPLALDGESAAEAGGNATAIAVVSAVSIVFAYVLLFALWRYVFSPKAKDRRRQRGGP